MKLKFLLAFVAFLLAWKTDYANENDTTVAYTGKPKKYYYKPGNVVFTDHFDDNQNNWRNTDSATKNISKFHSGNFFIQSSDTTSHFFTVPFDIDENRDFEIELMVKILSVKDDDKKVISVIWGYDSLTESKDMLEIAYNTAFTFKYCHGGDHKNCKHKSGRAYGRMRKEDYNRVTIRKVDSKCYIFFNRNLQRVYPFYKHTGKRLALGVLDEALIAFDAIYISYFN